jgi:murein DD-endopeptidase MepM/ murein hydrolase activator NlpD
MFKRNFLKITGVTFFLLSLCFLSCKENTKPKQTETKVKAELPKPKIEFGFNFDDYVVKRDTIKEGDYFGSILQRNNIDYSTIFNIVEQTKDTFNTEKIVVGKPYVLLCDNDSLQTPKTFIYQKNKVDYVVINFADSITAYNDKKSISYVQKEATGVIKHSLSMTMDKQGLPYQLINDMSDIYAWTIDFFRIQEGDQFKIIYTQRMIEDSIYAGIESIDAAYFEHKNTPFYSFNFEVDSTRQISDYFDDKAKSLRRTFLKAPVQFSRISSRYNPNRRIAYYGYKLRPHLGTDYAAKIGTEILATANGTVVESTRRGGNGKFVKIKHNATYSTQYLHMKAQNVRKGDYVKQGDVIGWVGMTGNTSGPHVCYRFWKNGKQVDPLREKLPEAESIPDSLKTKYLEFIKPYKKRLDALEIESEFPEFNQLENDTLKDIL